jgi:hypothetical protein
VSFFLPWVNVSREEATRYRERIEQRLEHPVHPVPAGVARSDWTRLAKLAEEQGYVTGLDVFYWARTATSTAGAYTQAEGDTPMASVPRAIHVTAIGLAVLPIAALLLALYFVSLRLRRAHSPALVVAVLDGILGILFVAAFAILHSGLGVTTSAGIGMEVLGIAGAALLLVGVFGVRLRNWWRVFIGSVVVGGGIALLVFLYVSSGGGP